MNCKNLLLLAATLLAISVTLVGCGDDRPGPNPAAEAARLDKAKSFRSYFDKAHGNYDALSPEDKTAFTKLTDGDEAKAKHAWDQMKYGPGGAPPGQGGGQPGAPGQPGN